MLALGANDDTFVLLAGTLLPFFLLLTLGRAGLLLLLSLLFKRKPLELIQFLVACVNFPGILKAEVDYQPSCPRQLKIVQVSDGIERDFRLAELAEREAARQLYELLTVIHL